MRPGRPSVYRARGCQVWSCERTRSNVSVNINVKLMMSRLRLFAGAGMLMCVPWLPAQEAMHEVRWSRERFAFPKLSAPALIEVPAVESSGFFFPYYLYVPKDISGSEPVRLLIEPNNTGQTTDDFEIHRASAKR